MGVCVKADWIEDKGTSHASDNAHESIGSDSERGSAERVAHIKSSYHLRYVYPDGSRVANLADPETLPTLCAARHEAIAIARELAADALRSGKAVEDAAIEICDADGEVLSIVWMQDAVLGEPV